MINNFVKIYPKLKLKGDGKISILLELFAKTYLPWKLMLFCKKCNIMFFSHCRSIGSLCLLNVWNLLLIFRFWNLKEGENKGHKLKKKKKAVALKRQNSQCFFFFFKFNNFINFFLIYNLAAFPNECVDYFTLS